MVVEFLSFIRVLLIFSVSGIWLTIIKLKFSRYDKSSLKSKLGAQAASTLQKMGPAFIKLGQTLSTRVDLVGSEVAKELTKLTDHANQFPYKEVERSIRAQFGCEVSKLFLEVEKKAVAAASIAQVHKAITLDGKHVAIKVLRPGIEKRFKRDLDVLYLVAKVFLLLFSDAKRLKPIHIVRMVEEVAANELDLRLEAASADKLRENCKSDEWVYIPKVFWSLTSKRILTLEWIEGIPINAIERLTEAGHDLGKLVERLAITFFNQAYRDGFFHADIHSGNVFVNSKGDLVLIDFGIMGHLDYKNRLFVAEILHGFIKRDYKRVADLHFKAGYVPKESSKESFELACRSIGEPIVGKPLSKISIGELLRQLFEITREFNMETQPQLLLLQKTMVTIEGTGSFLNSEVNMWKLAEPWINKWARNNLGYKGAVKKYRYDVEQWMDMLATVPSRLSSLEESLRHASNVYVKKNKARRLNSAYSLALAALVVAIIAMLS